MSLITRCPACGTMFKVVPDQLRISEGWVRCGHCAEVFDASANLQQDQAQPQPDPQAHTPPVTQPSGAAADSEAFDSSLTTEIGESVAFEEADSVQIEAEAQALVEQPLDRPFEFRREEVRESAVSRPRDSSFELESGLEDEMDPALHDVSFVRDARRQSVWQRPVYRTLLALAAVALAFLMAAQIAVHERDRLAAAAPGLRPLLAALCAPAKCRIEPPRQIDAIAIDNSSFNKLRGDAYRLNVTLKNQAGIEVAMPSLELTLTDGQDQAVVRRVLTPAELGPRAGVIAAASEWSGSLALALAADGTGTRIAGYRLLAFYP